MWGNASLRCPACGTQVGPDFVFCHACGTPLRPGPGVAPFFSYPPGYLPPEPVRAIPGVRTRRGLTLTILSLLLLWIPSASIIAGALLSVGSTLMFWDRHPFPPAHRSAMRLAYVLFWVAAALYAFVFARFVWSAYDAWQVGAGLDTIRPATELFIWLSTIPTEFLVAAIALQIRFLLPPKSRWQVRWAAVALGGLVLLATVIAYLDVVPILGPEIVRMSSVLGILNRISLARLVEGAGFVWFAYLYYRAHGNIVPKAAPVAGPPSIPGR